MAKVSTSFGFCLTSPFPSVNFWLDPLRSQKEPLGTAAVRFLQVGCPSCSPLKEEDRAKVTLRITLGLINGSDLFSEFLKLTQLFSISKMAPFLSCQHTDA